MSRIGKLPINIPDNINVTLKDKFLNVKGKLGELSNNFNDEVEVIFDQEQKKIFVKPANDSNKSKAMWGLYRSLISNMVLGVTDGFSIKLEINGVGYRAQVNDRILTLTLGYSHDILYEIEDGINIECIKPTLISITGIDKQRVGQVAASIRKLRKPEPYKGKGIKYDFEKINRKVGKKK